MTGGLKSLALLHLDYCCQMWNLPYNKDTKSVIDNVERRPTELVKGMENLHYEERPRQLDFMRLNTHGVSFYRATLC